MNTILQQIALIERIDRLIRMKATGSPKQLSQKLSISKTKLYRVLNTMKELQAPVIYDATLQSFIYEEPVDFSFGFYGEHDKLMYAG